jgi:hypothetical protein
MIHAALDHTRTQVKATNPPTAWLGEHYQLANCLTWTHWLRDQGIPALFAYVVFAADQSHQSADRTALIEQAEAVFAALGLSAHADWVQHHRSPRHRLAQRPPLGSKARWRA